MVGIPTTNFVLLALIYYAFLVGGHRGEVLVYPSLKEALEPESSRS